MVRKPNYILYLSSQLQICKLSTLMSIKFESNFIGDCGCFQSDYQKRSYSQGMIIKSMYEHKVLQKASRQEKQLITDPKLYLIIQNDKANKKSLKSHSKKINLNKNLQNPLQIIKFHTDRTNQIKDNTKEINKPSNSIIDSLHEIKPVRVSKYPLNNQCKMFKSTHAPIIFNQKISNTMPINIQKKYFNNNNQLSRGCYTLREIEPQIIKPQFKKVYQRYQNNVKNPQKQYFNHSISIPTKQINFNKPQSQVKPSINHEETKWKFSNHKRFQQKQISQFHSPLRNLASPKNINTEKNQHQSCPQKQATIDQRNIKNKSGNVRLKKKISITKTPMTLFKPHIHVNKLLNPIQIESVFGSDQEKSQTFSQVLYQESTGVGNHYNRVGFQLQSLLTRSQPINIFQGTKGTIETESDIKY